MEQLKERLAKMEESIALLLHQNTSTSAILDGIAMKADDNFRKVDGRLSKIENRLNALSNEPSSNFTEVGEQLGGIKAEIIKIGAATCYEQHHDDQNKFKISN